VGPRFFSPLSDANAFRNVRLLLSAMSWDQKIMSNDLFCGNALKTPWQQSCPQASATLYECDSGWKTASKCPFEKLPMSLANRSVMHVSQQKEYVVGWLAPWPKIL